MAQKNRNQKCKRCKMVEYIKTCDQYPCKFNFGHIFSSIVLSFSAGGKTGFQKPLFGGNG